MIRRGDCRFGSGRFLLAQSFRNGEDGGNHKCRGENGGCHVAFFDFLLEAELPEKQFVDGKNGHDGEEESEDRVNKIQPEHECGSFDELQVHGGLITGLELRPNPLCKLL
jgi:hypothetical protein